MKPYSPAFGRAALVPDRSALRARFAKLEQWLVKVRVVLEGIGGEAYLADAFLQDVVERLERT
jgi:hypothetical protein